MLKEQQNVPHGAGLPSEGPVQPAGCQTEERLSGVFRVRYTQNEMFILVLKITLRSNFLTPAPTPDQDGA